ncbi:MAG: DUF362 domain-containing protein [Desulfobacteraceae bacterium]|nr:MAG: DUF362 domain-containing protein [Desulfobacteraceae bacterium]
MKKATVIIKRLEAAHQKTSFTSFQPLSKEMRKDISLKVKEIFDALGDSQLLKSSREVYIKPNAVDAKAYSFTRPEVLEAVINYFKQAGAGKIFLMENATQANYTRLVFRGTGYTKLCRKTGAIPVFLDEETSETLKFSDTIPERDGRETPYDLGTFEMPATVMKLIRERDQHLYINVPKLKTHSMGVVTLGVKNQWGFPMHRSRGLDHNYNLHHKLVDVLGYIRPDVTLIEGVEGTIHGHYFATALADEQVKPFRVLIASKNVVAADMTGAKIFGLEVTDVPHLEYAIKRGLSDGVNRLEHIDIKGDITDISTIDLLGDRPENKAYPWDLYPRFPEDVAIIKGREMACREGCVNNPLCTMQTMYLDRGGKGGFTIVMGKGFDQREIDAITGRVLIVGHCAISETAEGLIQRLGRRKVYLSDECNNLCDTAQALFHLMHVNPAFYVPVNPLVAFYEMNMAKLKGSSSRVPNPFCHLIKMV